MAESLRPDAPGADQGGIAKRAGIAGRSGVETATAAEATRRARGAPPERHDRPALHAERHPIPAPRRRRPHPARRLVGPLVVLLVLVPAVLLALRAARGDLGTDPVETLEQQTGIWALRFLLLSLSV